MTNSLELFITELHFTFHNGRKNILHMWPINASVFSPYTVFSGNISENCVSFMSLCRSKECDL